MAIIKIIDAASNSKYDNKDFWDKISEFIIYSTDYELPRDILELLNLLLEN